MMEFSRFEIRDGVPFLNGNRIQGYESYRLVIDTDSGLSGTGELELKMTVRILNVPE